jgi:ADP-heptose:LPS heptosyltransferase
MRIVVFKLNHLGDNLVFLPGLQALRAHFPDWRLTIITTPAERVLYEQLTPADEILTGEKLRFDKCWQRPWELAAWWGRIRFRRPDACLLGFDQANVPHLLARSSGAAIRVGGNLEHIRLPHTLTHEVPMPASGLVADWNWELARTLLRVAGGVELAATPPPPDLSHRLLALPAPAARPQIVIHAGSSREFTRWPTDRFVQLATRLAADHEVVWVDRPETAGAALPATVRRVAPGSLREFATLLAGADLFLGNNSGPMHLANALGCPGVVVTGASALGWNPYWYRERWTVLRHPSLPCQPCERPDKVTLVCTNTAAPFACLQYWTVDAVEAACRETLARTVGCRQG